MVDVKIPPAIPKPLEYFKYFAVPDPKSPPLPAKSINSFLMPKLKANAPAASAVVFEEFGEELVPPEFPPELLKSPTGIGVFPLCISPPQSTPGGQPPPPIAPPISEVCISLAE